MFLLDTNIFLEYILKRSRVSGSEGFLFPGQYFHWFLEKKELVREKVTEFK